MVNLRTGNFLVTFRTHLQICIKFFFSIGKKIPNSRVPKVDLGVIKDFKVNSYQRRVNKNNREGKAYFDHFRTFD